MDALLRLKLLSDQMNLEPAEEHSPAGIAPVKPALVTKDLYVHPAQMPGGRQILLLKTLLTSACERDCFYCPFRAGRDFRRASFKPEEFANLFFEMVRSWRFEMHLLFSHGSGNDLHRPGAFVTPGTCFDPHHSSASGRE